MTGYLSPHYAQSLGEFGTPRRLTHCAGSILERPIAGTDWHDAMGIYPRFVCRDWQALATDLDELSQQHDGPLCVSLVTDPFGNWTESLLQHLFPDRLIPFKTHFVVDLAQPGEAWISSHHRYYARVALRSVTVEPVEDQSTFLDVWDALYAELARRHDLHGIKRFSRASFARQLAVPGLKAFQARDLQGSVVAAQLWYQQGDMAYNHLAASAVEGYRLNASYALYDHALRWWRSQVRWLDLGAGAGLDPSGGDGLSQFKRGWSNELRPVYFCGKVLDRARYDAWVQPCRAESTPYFPAYRAGEFE